MATPRPAGRNRRHATIIIGLFVVAVAAAAVAGWRYAREAPPHQGPIVVITVDSLPGDAVTDNPGPNDSTPALAALAADGVVFTRAYAHSTARVPAHASLATGLLPFEHGVRDDGGFTLGEDTRTMAELLRSRGFVTGGAASSFLLRRSSGLGQGFTFYDATMPEPATPESVVVERDGLQTYEAAEEWMRAQDDRRYFLAIDVDRESAEPVVARLVGELKARRLYEEATLVLTADRGAAGSGATLTDADVRVPLIVKQPFGEGAGRQISLPVQHIDLLPTLLDFVRAPVPGNLRGRSLRPLLDNEDATLTGQPLYAESLEAAMRFGGYPLFSITDGTSRLVRGEQDEVTTVEGGSAAGNAALAETLDRLLRDRTLGTPEAIRSEDEQHFAAAGYLAGLREWSAPAPPLQSGDQRAILDAHRAAVARLGIGDGQGGIAALRAILRTYPALSVVQFQLGVQLLKAGRLTEALAALMASETLRPDNAEIATTLATTALRAGMTNEASSFAEQAVTRARSKDPSSRVAAHLAALQVALALKDAAAGASHVAEIGRIDARLPLGDYLEGRVAFDEGRFEDAAAALQNASRALQDRVSVVPDLPLLLGDALVQQDRLEDAEAAYRRALDVAPGSVRAYTSLATLYQASDRMEAMAQTLDALIEEVPTAEGYAAAVRVFLAAGDRPRATALRAEARRRFRNEPAAALPR